MITIRLQQIGFDTRLKFYWHKIRLFPPCTKKI